MTKQTNISTAISPDYKHCWPPLYDLALANDLLAGWILADCPDSGILALTQEFGDCSDYGHDEIEDMWSNHVYNTIQQEISGSDEQFAHDIFEEKIAQDLAVFENRISALFEILNKKIEEAA